MQLHHQGETPSMRDQGFAVAPGTHTLVGVKRMVVFIKTHLLFHLIIESRLGA